MFRSNSLILTTIFVVCAVPTVGIGSEISGSLVLAQTEQSGSAEQGESDSDQDSDQGESESTEEEPDC